MNTILEPGSGRHAVRHSAPSICLAGICGVLLFAGICWTQTSSVVTLTFEGLQDGEYINNYYNGGYGLLADPFTGLPTSTNGSGPGPNYGITFGSDSLALITINAGGSGNFSGNPSGNTVAFFLTGPGVVMNASKGFSNGFSFYYAASSPGSVTVYDGFNGTGNILATLSLSANVTSTNCPVVNDSITYCNWQQIGVQFTGTARSVNFSGAANFIGFDNITLGTNVATAPLVITTTSLLPGSVGTVYNAPLSATGGTTPYTWTATGLPPGLTVTNGSISGTPATPGTYPVSLRVTDSTSPSLSVTTSQPLTLIVNPASVVRVTCDAQSSFYIPGAPYSATCTASGGTAPYAWSFTSLPSWLKSSATTGASITLSGTTPPAPPNVYTVGVTVTDSTTPARQTASTTFIVNLTTLTVSCVPQSGSFTAGASYSATCTASGGTAPYTWSLSSLPSWLKSSATTGASITLSGTTPPAPPNVYTVGVTVTDSTTPARQTASTTFIVNLTTLTVSCVPQSGSFTAGASYSATCTASGGTAPYTWSFSSLPSWLTSSTTTGASTTLSGTVPDPPPASYSVTVTVTDSTSSAKQTNSTTVTINVSARALTVSCVPQSGSYPASAQYSTTCTASGGAGPYTWSFSTLPSWLKSSGTSGATITLSGTVPAPPPPSYSVTATVTDSSSTTRQTASTTVTVNVLSVPQLTCNPASGPVIAGVPYSSTCTVSGGAPPYTFSASAGSLPSGLTAVAGAATYSISGTPAASGAYSFTLQVKDSAGQTAAQSFSGTISPAPSVSSFSLAAIPSAANQYTTNLTLSSAPPTTLSGLLCLTFTADPSVGNASGYQSQEVVFANGTTNAACSSTLKTSLVFTVPAGSSAAVWSGNSSQFSQGTVAGTITVTLKSLVDSNGNSVLPSAAPSQKITIPAGAPALVGSPTMTTAASSVTVVFNAVTPKRSVTGVTCVFNPSSGQPLTSSVSFSSGSFAGADQSQWFGTPASLATGGSFSLSVTFSCTNCSALNAVQVTLSN